MRFQLPELHCFYVPGLFFYAVAKQSKFVKTTNFSPTFPPLFSVGFPPPENFRPRYPDTQKKGSPTKRNCPKTWKSFL